MISPQRAIDIAKDYCVRKRLGWSESSLYIETKMIKGDPCYVIYTCNVDLSKLGWLEMVTTTPFHVYVSMVTGKCIGCETGNRGIEFER